MCKAEIIPPAEIKIYFYGSITNLGDRIPHQLMPSNAGFFQDLFHYGPAPQASNSMTRIAYKISSAQASSASPEFVTEQSQESNI